MPGPWVSAIGAAAAVCSMASFAPQLLKIIRERGASGVSLRMYAVTVAGFCCWIAYGLLIGSWPVAASNGVCLLLSAAILIAKWRYSGPDAARPAPPAHERA